MFWLSDSRRAGVALRNGISEKAKLPLITISVKSGIGFIERFNTEVRSLAITMHQKCTLVYILPEQECIPVGCVPPACYPYLPAGTAPEGGCVPARGVVPAQGVYLLGGVPAGGVPTQGVCLLWGVPAGGCTYPGEVYLPGGCTCQRGVPAQGRVPAQGVYLPGGTCPGTPPRGQTHTCKNITFSNFVCGR